MKLTFITTNPHKIAQARAVLEPFGIDVVWKKQEYDESSDDTIEQIAAKAAKHFADKLNKPVIVEDTGVFFDAYPGFPGAFPKFVFSGIGYEGLFRLLRGKSKKARFVSAVGFCRPGKKAKVIKGEMGGRIVLKVHKPRANVLPYERIFIPEGKSSPLVDIPMKEKLKILHRTKALSKLGNLFRARKL